MESSLSEKPERHAPRRLSDHLMVEGQMQKVHSLVDKVYSRRNLKLAWERVRANQGASGTDGIMIGEFEANLEANLERLHRELREETYQPLPVRRLEIPKRGSPGKTRPLGIPSVYDRVCQQALVNRLGPIFEKVFDPSSFGYRKGRRTADALTKNWREIEAGSEWIVDADLKDYFGSVDHDKLLALVGKQIADSKALKLIQQMLKAGYEDKACPMSGASRRTSRKPAWHALISPARQTTPMKRAAWRRERQAPKRRCDALARRAETNVDRLAMGAEILRAAGKPWPPAAGPGHPLCEASSRIASRDGA